MSSTDRRKRNPARKAGASFAVPVVGLGGSAGALESFKTFFTAMPADSGAAFVVVQHLARDHHSLLSELLSQYTRMPVAEAGDGSRLEANRVYIIPPDRYLAMCDGCLYLSEPPSPPGMRLPIDFFLRSLAEDRLERAVGILFSGTGSDGTLGVRELRGRGGLTLAQDPRTAPFAELPRSAIAAGFVDLILAPKDMPKALTEYLRQPYAQGALPPSGLEADEATEGRIDEILGLVRARAGHDFRGYKRSMLLRRIRRRMGLRHLASPAEYLDLLRQSTDEVGQLSKDLLINVTAFFRDPEAFEELRLSAIVPLVAAKPTDEPLRAWVCGCSSGEEAYSLAMLLYEAVEAAEKHCPVQVFGTDIDEEALHAARMGVYPESIAADVGPERLSKYFVKKGSGFQVNETLRRSMVFANQNLITDPPFSRMDIVNCRNLLIYLDADTQAKLIPVFHFALNPGGFLFLGNAEGIGEQIDLFETVSKKFRTYRRISFAGPLPLTSLIARGRRRIAPIAAGPAASRSPAAAAYGEAIREALLHHFAAAVVLVDRKGQALQFHGMTGKYLNMPASEPDLNLLSLAKQGLARKLRTAMHKAADSGKAVVLKEVPIVDAGRLPAPETPDGEAAPPAETTTFARITVMPIPRRDTEPLLAVIFEDVHRPAVSVAEAPSAGDDETVVRQLENELRITQQDLQSTIGELQASNEELQVANEEVLSTNEELQSANEELETSHEELQSVNEELSTANSQLQEKIERVDAAKSEAENERRRLEAVMEALPVGMAIVDAHGQTLRTNAAFAQVWGGTPPKTDSIGDFVAYRARWPETGEVVAPEEWAASIAIRKGERVVGQLVELERFDGTRGYALNSASPVRDAAGRIIGGAVAIQDMTELRRAQREREVAAEFLHVVNRSRGTAELVREALTFFKAQSGCEAVGIRLKEGEDFPYYEARGFPAEFIALESSLCVRDLAGQLVRDDVGSPVLECMCGNVICGRFDPAQPFFTPVGSFWSNGTTELLKRTTDAERQAHTRNRCNGQGYESVALLALRVGEERLGLLQLNDKRKGMFSRETIVSWERLVGYLAVALAKARAEEALAKERTNLQTIFDVVGVGLLLVDEKGAVRRVNDTVSKWVGKDLAAAVGAQPGDLVGCVHALSDPAGCGHTAHCVACPIRATFEAVLRSGEAVHRVETPATLSIGGKPAPLWLEVSADPLSIEGRRHVLLAMTDITARKQAEAALNAALDRAAWLARFPDENPNPVVRVAADGRVLYSNPAAATLPGWACRVGEPLPAELLPLVGRVMAEDRADEADVNIGGTYFSVAVAPVSAECYANVYGRNVTMRRQAQEALTESRRNLAAIVDTISDGFYTLDDDWRFVHINDAALRHFGKRRDELLGRTLYEAFPSLRGSPFEAECRRAVESGAPVHFTIPSALIEGTMSIFAYPGERRLSVLFRDVTAEKRAEEELRRQAEELAASNRELSRFNRAMVDRELRMIELKNQVNELCARLGEAPRYETGLAKGEEASP